MSDGAGRISAGTPGEIDLNSLDIVVGGELRLTSHVFAKARHRRTLGEATKGGEAANAMLSEVPLSAISSIV